MIESSDISNTEKYKEYRYALHDYDNILFVVDESFGYLTSNDFSRFCKYVDSFFLLITRDSLKNLPYSYREIYTFYKSGKYNYSKPVFNPQNFLTLSSDQRAVCLIEDSNSGYEFFKQYYFTCDSANGKSNVCKSLDNKSYDIIVADGAAFGSEIEEVVDRIKDKNIILFLPESFEYVLLNSKLFSDATLEDKCNHTVKYADGLFFSWKNYFIICLKDYVKRFYNSYSKGKLNKCYYVNCCIRKQSKCNIILRYDKVKTVLSAFFNNTNDNDSNLSSLDLFS